MRHTESTAPLLIASTPIPKCTDVASSLRTTSNPPHYLIAFLRARRRYPSRVSTSGNAHRPRKRAPTRFQSSRHMYAGRKPYTNRPVAASDLTCDRGRYPVRCWPVRGTVEILCLGLHGSWLPPLANALVNRRKLGSDIECCERRGDVLHQNHRSGKLSCNPEPPAHHRSRKDRTVEAAKTTTGNRISREMPRP